MATLQALAAQGAAFIAFLLMASAVHKSYHRARSRQVVQDFAGIPGSIAGAALGLAVGCEVVAAVSMVVPSSRGAGAVLAAAIWAAYLGLLIRAILQNRRDVDCGCSFGAAHRPLGAFQLTRNAVLIGVSAAVAVVSSWSAVPPPVTASQLLGAGALLALYGAVDQVMALQPLRAGVNA